MMTMLLLTERLITAHAKASDTLSASSMYYVGHLRPMLVVLVRRGQPF